MNLPEPQAQGMAVSHSRLIFILTAALALSLILTPPAHAAGPPVSFNPAVTQAVGYGLGTPLTGDFDGDGNDDIAIPYAEIPGVCVLLGNGDVTFTRVTPEASVGFQPSILASADFNEDSNLDLVLIDRNASDLPVLLGHGDGSFAAGTPISSGVFPSCVTCDDLNGDHHTDVLITGQLEDRVVVRLGNGNGTFTAAADETVGSRTGWVDTGDFNGDGDVDMAVTNLNDNTVSVRMGNGDGTFSAAETETVGARPQGIAVGDLNNDGRDDFAVANWLGASVWIRTSNGDGTFSAAETQAVGYPHSVLLQDMNKDGALDLISTLYVEGSPNPGQVALALGNGDGTFEEPMMMEVGAQGRFSAAGDFNDDKWPDIVTAAGDGNTLAILVNRKLETVMNVAAYSPSLAYNHLITFSTTLFCDDAPIQPPTGVMLWSKRAAGGSSRLLGLSAFDRGLGAYRTSLRMTENTIFEVRFTGDETYSAFNSGEMQVGAQAYLSKPWIRPLPVRRVGLFTIGGTLKPAHSGYTAIYFYRYYRGAYRYFCRRWARNRSSSAMSEYRYTFRTNWSRKYSGRYMAFARHEDASHVMTRSPKLYFTVR